MRKLIKNIIIIITLLILQAGVAMAQLHYGMLTVNGNPPAVSALTFTAYVNGDDNYLITEKISNGYQINSSSYGVWQLNTVNFINESADTSGTLSVDFHADGQTKVGNISITSAGTIRTDFILDQTDSVAQPTVVATAGDNKVTLTWAAVSGATSYKVYRNSGTDNGYYTRISSNATSPYVDSTAVNGTTYNYIIVAIGSSARGAHSAVQSATPTSGTTVPETLVSIDVSPASPADKFVGDTLQFTATGNIDVNNDGTVDKTANLSSAAGWSVGNNIGTISKSGLFTATQAGQGTITATSKEGSTTITKSVNLTVKAITLEYLTITPETIELPSGQPQKYTVKAKYSNSTTLQDVSEQASWSLDSNLNGTVTSSGEVVTTKPGEGKITATYTGVSTSAVITSIPGRLNKIILTPSNTGPIDITGVSQVVTISAVGYDKYDNNVGLLNEYIWDLDPDSTSAGYTIVAQLGTNEATLTSGSRATNCEITLTGRKITPNPLVETTVTAKTTLAYYELTGISLDPDVFNIQVANKAVMAVRAVYDNILPSEKMVSREVTWTINPVGYGSVATVESGNDGGKFEFTAANKSGLVTLEANYKGEKALAEIVIGAPLANVIIEPMSASITAGESKPFSLIASYSDDSATTKEVGSLAEWSLSLDGGMPTTVTSTITPTVSGTGVLTASYFDSASQTEKTTSAAITVLPGTIETVAMSVEKTMLMAGEQILITAEGFDRYQNKLGQVNYSWNLPGGLPLQSLNNPVAYTAGNKAGTYEIVVVGVDSASNTVTAYKSITIDNVKTLSFGGLSSTIAYGSSDDFDIAAAYYFEKQTQYPNSGVTFTVTPAIATVESGSLLMYSFVPKQKGDCVVTAYYQGVTASANVKVSSQVKSLEIVPNSVSLKAGQQQKFTVTSTYDDNITTAEVLGQDANWLISPYYLGSVQNGVLTAVATGTGQVTVSYAGKATTAAISILANDLAQIAVTANKNTVEAGGQVQFIAAGADSYSNVVSVTPKWLTSLGTISANGLLSIPTNISGVKTVKVQAQSGSVIGTKEVGLVAGSLVTGEITPKNTLALVGGTINFTGTGYDQYKNIITSESWTYTAPATAGSYQVSKVLTDPRDKKALTVSTTVTVSSESLAQIIVTANKTTAEAGGKVQFTAVGKDSYSNAVSVTPKWQATLGTISANGLLSLPTNISGVKSVKVQAQSGSVIGTREVGLVAGSLVTGEITPKNTSALVGGTINFTGTGYDQYKNIITSESWTYTAPATAGSYQVSKVLTDPRDKKTLTVSTTVTVSSGSLAQIMVTANKTTAEAGGKVQFTAVGKDSYSNAVSVTPKWQATLGTISTNGLLTLPSKVVAGTIVTVEASVGTIMGTEEITLVAAPTSSATSPASAAVNKVMITAPSAQVKAGEKLQLSVAAFDAQQQTITINATDCAWTVSSGSINSAGLLTAPTKVATVTVTAKYSSAIYNSVAITVIPNSLAIAEISPAKPSVEAGSKVNLAITGHDKYKNKIVTEYWQYTAPQKAGTYKVTRTIVDNRDSSKKSADVDVVVVPAALASIKVSPSLITLEVEGSQLFTASGYDSYGNEIAGLSFTYTSPFGTTALVAIPKTTQAGTYYFVATSGKVSGQAKIEVVEKLAEIKFVKTYVADKKSGSGQFKVEVQGLDSKGQAYSLKDTVMQYKVTGTEHGNSIDSSGNFIPGSKEGKFTITAVANVAGKAYTTTTNVDVNIAAPTITVTSNGKELKSGTAIGEEQQLKVKAVDGNLIKSINVYFDSVKANAVSAKSDSAGAEEMTAYYAPDKTLTPGKHTILIEAEDYLGTKSSVTIDDVEVASAAGISGTPMNYPNPFAPSSQTTTINYSLTKAADIRIYIYDLARRQVYSAAYASGTNGGQLGENEITWNGKDMSGQIVANGVYVYLITSDGKVVGSGEISVFE